LATFVFVRAVAESGHAPIYLRTAKFLRAPYMLIGVAYVLVIKMKDVQVNIGLGAILEIIAEAVLELMAYIFEAMLRFGFKGTANAIYGNRNGGPQTIARWLLYITIIASVPITITYMIYEKPFSLTWTALAAIELASLASLSL
jgi:hypothetical protein